MGKLPQLLDGTEKDEEIMRDRNDNGENGIFHREFENKRDRRDQK